jgi:hypothetical protein
VDRAISTRGYGEEGDLMPAVLAMVLNRALLLHRFKIASAQRLTCPGGAGKRTPASNGPTAPECGSSSVG